MKKGKNKEFWKYRPVRQVLNNLDKNALIMDVGSGIPDTCFDLENRFKFHNFICLDKAQSEIELIDYWIYYYVYDEQKHIARQSKNFSDIRNAFFRERNSEIPVPFETRYDIRLNYDISENEISGLPKPDVLLFLNVLHFLPVDVGLNLLKEFGDLVNPQGVVVLWVNHYQNYLMKNPDHTVEVGFRSYQDKKFKDTCYLYSEKDFMNAVNVFKDLNYKTLQEPTKYMNDDNKTIQSMIYICQAS